MAYPQELTPYMTTTPLNYPKKRIRLAVLSLFVAQGLCFASWASRLTDIRSDFKVEDFLYFGILMFMPPIGKFIAIPSVGFLLPRIGSKKTVFISILGYAISLVLIGWVTNIYALAVMLFFFGTFWNMTDISLNTQAIETERLYGRPIIATFHATWSLSACVGAVIGFVMINLNIIPFHHYILIAFIAIALVLFNYKYLQEKSAEDQEQEGIEQKAEKSEVPQKRFHLPELLLIQLGLIWLVALIVENTMFEWSNVYFESVINAPKSLQVGFLVFMIMMFTGRMLTNFAYSKWSKRTVLIIAGLLIFVGFFTSSLFIGLSDDMVIKVVINSLGFMFIGLGISCVVPTLYSIVGDKAKTPVGLALTIMSGISFVGPLVAPLMVGAISRQYKLEYAYLTVGVMGLIIVAIAIFTKTLRK